MQSRDSLSDDLTPRFADSRLDYEDLRPYPMARRTFALIASWLIPGAGHLILGKIGRGLLFFVTIAGSFALGLALHGRLFWPALNETGKLPYFDLITVLWSFAQVGAGLCFVVSYLFNLGTDPQPWVSSFEYGNTFMFLAGLLNYLVMHDAFDIGAGRKR